MVNRHQMRAQQVIASFKELIDAAALETITDAQFKELELLVRAAIADELHNAAEQVENLARRLREEVELNNLAL
jgi:Ni,Fe-hydrogenase maturation factor